MTPSPDHPSFDEVWHLYIIPLAGKTLTLPTGGQNKLTRVDWTGVHRITSTGRPGFLPLEIFKLAYSTLLARGEITRDEINQLYEKRGSSGVALILSQVPFISYSGRPATLRLQIPSSEPRPWERSQRAGPACRRRSGPRSDDHACYWTRLCGCGLVPRASVPTCGPPQVFGEPLEYPANDTVLRQ